MNQPDLPFGRFHAVRVLTPAARNTDPVTSHQAVEQVTKTGKRVAHQAHVLELIRAHPGLTTAELARHTSMPRAEIARRAPELRTAGDAYNGPVRKCTACGNNSITWWAR